MCISYGCCSNAPVKQTPSERRGPTIQALARPAEDQVTLFPDFPCKADELALGSTRRCRVRPRGRARILELRAAATSAPSLGAPMHRLVLGLDDFSTSRKA